MKKTLMIITLATLTIGITACGSKTGFNSDCDLGQPAESSSAPTVEDDFDDIDIEYSENDTEHSKATYPDGATIKDKIAQDLEPSDTKVKIGYTYKPNKIDEFNYTFGTITLPSNNNVTFLAYANTNKKADTLTSVAKTVDTNENVKIMKAGMSNQYETNITCEMLDEPYSTESIGKEYEDDNVTVKAVEYSGIKGFIVYPATKDKAIEDLRMYLNIGNFTADNTNHYLGLYLTVDGKMVESDDNHYKTLADYIANLLDIDLTADAIQE